MAIYIQNQQVIPAPELLVTMTGSPVLIGTLLGPPIKLILDNLSTVTVTLYIDIGGGLIQFKTFAAGEAIILDGDFFTYPTPTFYGNGASGSFSIAYSYIKFPF